MLNEASAWRLDLARRLASAYAANPHVQAVILGGSAAYGHADRYSDVELGVFWRRPPTGAERVQAAALAGGVNLTLDEYDATQGVWVEDYFVHNVNIDLVHRLTSATDQLITDVTQRYDTAFHKQTVVYALQRAVPLAGAPVISSWHARVDVYPDGLMYEMVANHLAFKPWWSVEVLAQRESLILVHQALCTGSERMLSALLGMNRIYHPGFKWLPKIVRELKIAPRELDRRLKQCFHGDVLQRVQVARALIEDTFDLAARHLPTLDLVERWDHFRQRRTPVDHAPRLSRMPHEEA